MRSLDLTAELVRRAAATRRDALPPEIVTLASHCLLDWFGVAIAGSHEPVVEILRSELCDGSGPAPSTVVGRGARGRPWDVARVNATAAHALDFDDVTPAMTGHPSAATVATALAVGEQVGAGGAHVLAAYVAGYELQCAVSQAIEPAQYERGFHTTGTTGTFGAAIAAATLMELDLDHTIAAVGIAATQAAGLRSAFGTMCKPLNAGNAAANGVMAARLAACGVTAARRPLEGPDGFGPTHGEGIDVDRALERPATGFHLTSNLFKFHAACYGTHSCIEGVRALQAEAGFGAADVDQVVVHASTRQHDICAVPAPETGLEAKFSLAHTVAMALCHLPTAAPAAYDRSVHDAGVAALRARVHVVVDRTDVSYTTPVDVVLCDGRRLHAAHDVTAPTTDLGCQQRALARKFDALVAPVLGATRCSDLRGAILSFDAVPAVTSVVALAAADPRAPVHA